MLRPETDLVHHLGMTTSLVYQRAGALVQRVNLDLVNNRLILQGRSRSFYGKQLAQEALLSSNLELPVVNEIVVD
jgi:hypothetical protein